MFKFNFTELVLQLWVTYKPMMHNKLQNNGFKKNTTSFNSLPLDEYQLQRLQCILENILALYKVMTHNSQQWKAFQH